MVSVECVCSSSTFTFFTNVLLGLPGCNRLLYVLGVTRLRTLPVRGATGSRLSSIEMAEAASSRATSAPPSADLTMSSAAGDEVE